MLCGLAAGSEGTCTETGGLPSRKRGEKVFTYATRSARCCSVSGNHDGMFEFMNPRVTDLKRSLSLGSSPLGVERHLNVPVTKSRGLGSTHGAFSPRPSPSGP